MKVAAETKAVIYAGESAESEPRTEVSMDLQKEIRRTVEVAAENDAVICAGGSADKENQKRGG